LVINKILLSKKFSQPMFLIIMSFGMSITMSCVVTLVNTGFNDGFFDRYINAFTFAFPIAIVAVFIMGPIAKIVVNKLISND